MRPLPYIIGTKSYLNSTDAGLGGINVYDDDDHDDDVRGVVDNSNSVAVDVEVAVGSISSQYGDTVLAIDTATPKPITETGANDFKPPPANKPSLPPPPPTAPRTVTSTLFQSVVNTNDHDNNDVNDDHDVDANFSSYTSSSSQSSAPPSIPPPPPTTTHQSSSQSSSSVSPPLIPMKSSIQDMLNQKFLEKNIQNPTDLSNNSADNNRVLYDKRGGFNDKK